MRDISDLKQRQALPLNAKVLMSQHRIREWYNHWNGDVYVSFSGGKDSTVLSYLVRDMYPDVPLVYSNTGLEYPENQKLAREMGAVFIRPDMPFSEVVSKYGYPIISKEVSASIWAARKLGRGLEAIRRRNDLLGKRELDNVENASDKFNKEKWLPLSQGTQFLIGDNCCEIMKKRPLAKYQKKIHSVPYIGTLAEESRMREQLWVKFGCNAFDTKKPMSKPLSFWTEQDILHFIKNKGIKISEAYGEILATDESGFVYEPMPGVDCKLKCSKCQRTGCIFCAFGVHLEKKGITKIQMLANTHPKQYEYCMGGGQWVDNPKYDPAAPKMDGDWVNWNPKKIWVPSKKGLGMKKVFDNCNAIYGKDFIRYD